MAGKNVERKAFEAENEAEVKSETQQRLRFMSLLHVKIIFGETVNFHKSNRSWRFNLFLARDSFK